MCMKVVELINKLEELGYNEDTKIFFGFYDYGGEWYNFKVEEIEADDREMGYDTVGVVLEHSQDYAKSILSEANIELENDLMALIEKYC